MLPFRDYVLVMVRKYGGLTQHINGGRKLCQLAPNPVLSALLGRSVCGNALVLRLRMVRCGCGIGTQGWSVQLRRNALLRLVRPCMALISSVVS